MPNWCQNEIVFTHESKEKVDGLEEAVQKEKILNYLRPMPHFEEGDGGWYPWCIENWGTKWDVENMSQLLSSKDITLRGKKTWSLLYLFGSAWSPPKDAILHISKDFSELEFTLSFWEGGNGFKGMFKCKDGKIKKDVTEEYSGRRGG